MHRHAPRCLRRIALAATLAAGLWSGAAGARDDGLAGRMDEYLAGHDAGAIRVLYPNCRDMVFPMRVVYEGEPWAIDGLTWHTQGELKWVRQQVTLGPNGVMEGWILREPLYVPPQAFAMFRSFGSEGFRFMLAAQRLEDLTSKTPVYRLVKGHWLCQPYEALNPRFLPSLALCRATVADGRVSAKVVTAAGGTLAAGDCPAPDGMPPELSDWGLGRTETTYFGCLAAPSASPNSETITEATGLWLYELRTGGDGEQAGDLTLHPVSVEPALKGKAGDEQLQETVTLLPPSLSSSAASGMLLWRKRVIGAEKAPGRGVVYELVHRRPEGERIAAVYATYTGPEGDRVWAPDGEGGYSEDKTIPAHPNEAALGLRYWPCCGISPDGTSALALCGLKMLLVTL